MKRVVVALATAALLAGCATVPTSGQVRSGTESSSAPDRPVVAVKAQKPRQNMDQLAIVNGFLEAMADTTASDVAREYLTAAAAAQWKPATRISVYDQSSTTNISRRSDDTIELAAPLVGTIDQRGSWTPAPQKSGLTFAFKLAKVSDQWRITNAPPGVFLGSNQLEIRLERLNLYFFNPDRTMLVPDPVYLPVTASTGQSATQLVQELLKGPTGRLGTGVVSAVPPGAQVNVSVPVDYGVATVALSGIGALSDEDRRKLAAQIAWTLLPISARVKITVGGAPLLPGEAEEQPFSNFSRYDPSVPAGQLYAVRAGEIHQVTGLLDGSEAIDSLPLRDSLLFRYKAESFAVSPNNELGAVVPRDEQGFVVVARLTPTDQKDVESRVPTEGKVLRPSFDSQQRLWVLDRADSAAPRLRIRMPDGRLIPVATDFDGLQPTVFRMAPDGVRALLVEKKGASTAVRTGTIAADDNKRPTLRRDRSLHLPLRNISDASWYKTDEILVAGASGPGLDRQPWEVKVDGAQPTLVFGASGLDVAALAASASADVQPVVRDRAGNLHWQSKDLSWLPILGDDIHDNQPVYPG